MTGKGTFGSRKLLLAGLMAVALVVAGALSPVHAGQFATYTDQGNDFAFTANGSTNATFSATNAAVIFDYTGITGLPAALIGDQAAHLTFSTSTTTGASTAGGSDFQPFNGISTLTITRDTPYNGLTNLLTVTFQQNTSLPTMSGNDGSHAASINASTPDILITYTSDFLNFGTPTSRRLFLNVLTSSTTPILFNPASDTFLESFIAAVDGQFYQLPQPTAGPLVAVPEPTTFALSAVGLVGLAGAAAYRRRKHPTV
jgi:PEP-CTERM motif